MEHLTEAEDMMDSGLPRGAVETADWAMREDVRLLAAEIQLYEDSWQAGAVPERNLKVLDAILAAAKNHFMDREEDACQARVRAMKQRLSELGIEMSEPALLPLLTILGLILLPTLLRRKN